MSVVCWFWSGIAAVTSLCVWNKGVARIFFDFRDCCNVSYA